MGRGGERGEGIRKEGGRRKKRRNERIKKQKYNRKIDEKNKIINKKA